MSLDARTRLVALLGDPVAHSLSPLIHNTAFRARGVNLAYAALPVRRDDLAAAVAGLRALHFAGANLTIPHKEAVMPLLDALTPTAEAIGAVNVVVAEDDDGGVRLRGDNTDVAGFLAPLQAHADALAGGEVVVFGAGGAARAVVYGLLTRLQPARLTLVVRRPEQAEALAADLAAHDARGALAVAPFGDAAPAVEAARLVVNATPLGMHPREETTPWEDAAAFDAATIVYDAVYAPEETRLLREAAARGATTIGGLDMLLGQAEAAFTQWTGRPFPADAVRTALRAR